MKLSPFQLTLLLCCCMSFSMAAKLRDFVMEMVETVDCAPYKDSIKGRFITNGFHYKGETTTGDIAMEMFEETTDDLSITVNIMKCKSRENPDTCETYLSFPIPSWCNMIKHPKGMWKSYINSYSPPLECPMKPKLYNATNLEFDNKSLNFFMGGGVHWKLLAHMKEGSGKVIMCLVLLAGRS